MFKNFMDRMGEYYNEQEYFTSRFSKSSGKWAKFKKAMVDLYDELDYFYGGRKTSAPATCTADDYSGKWAKFKKAIVDLYDELDYFYGGRKTSAPAVCTADKNYKKIA